MNYENLLNKAYEARKSSYSPYSNFKVGAALLAESGKVYLGCNIENAAYSATVCAERVALFKAVSEGERAFRAIAVVGGKEGEEEKSCPPCGVCRQVLSEFCDETLDVVLCDKTYALKELLPLAFGGLL